MRSKLTFVYVMLALLAVVFVAPTSSAAVKTLKVECADSVNVAWSWVPAGAPVVGDSVKLQNLTEHPITNVKWNGTLKEARVAAGTTTDHLGTVAIGDVLSFCARCDAKKGADALLQGCVYIDDLLQESDTAVIDYECGSATCYLQTPTTTNLGLLILVGLLLMSGLYVIYRRRQGVMDVQ